MVWVGRVGKGNGNNPHNPMGVRGDGNYPNWDSPSREKHEPNPGSPRGGKGDGKHQPPLAGVGGTAGAGGVLVDGSSRVLGCYLGSPGPQHPIPPHLCTPRSTRGQEEGLLELQQCGREQQIHEEWTDVPGGQQGDSEQVWPVHQLSGRDRRLFQVQEGWIDHPGGPRGGSWPCGQGSLQDGPSTPSQCQWWTRRVRRGREWWGELRNFYGIASVMGRGRLGIWARFQARFPFRFWIKTWAQISARFQI